MKIVSSLSTVFCALMMSAICIPSIASAQEDTNGVMRLVCFESSDPNGRPVDGGWLAVITQMTSEVYSADIFIPDEDGNYEDMFPMFENTMFLISIFENAEIADSEKNISEIAAELLMGDVTPGTILAEGNRVNSLLDLSWGGSNKLKYDSINPSMNIFVDFDQDVELTPYCNKPFIMNEKYSIDTLGN
ncbi:MAG: hypothetical protein AAFQ64_16820 [Pseudomonadota bacterium]